MDFITVLIFISILLSTLAMIIGPALEFKGKFFFLENKNPPKTSKRYGMWIMTISAIIFVVGCIARQFTNSSYINIVVISSYVLWFIGGFVSLIRNETLKMLVQKSED